MSEIKNTSEPDGATQPQPGAVIVPGGVPPAQAPAVESAPAPTEVVVKVPENPSPAFDKEAAEPAAQSQPGQPTPSENAQYTDGNDPSVTWTASEFVAHDKSAGWYAMLAVVAVVLATLIYILTKDVVSVVVVIIAGLLLGIYGAHKPRQLEYRIDKQGVGIGQKYHGYNEFKSFSVVPEGAFSSIIFMPLKRFALPITIYYAPNDEERILAFLSDQLPFEEYRHDAVDKLMRNIRF